MAKSPRQSIIERGTAPNASEDAIQTCFFLMLHDLAVSIPEPRLSWVHAIPNGGAREAVSAGVMVATGTRSGVWDVTIPFPSGCFPFGSIEFKRPQVRKHKNGGLSDNQVEYGKHLVSVGAWFAICYSAEEAIHAIRMYLNGQHFYTGEHT